MHLFSLLNLMYFMSGNTKMRKSYSLKAVKFGQTHNFDGPYEEFKVRGKPKKCLACGSRNILVFLCGHIDSNEPLPAGYASAGCEILTSFDEHGNKIRLDPAYECEECRADFFDLEPMEDAALVPQAI